MFFQRPPIDLGDVTLVSVTGVHIDAAQRALQLSMQRLRFGRVLLISSQPASVPDPAIERIAIPPLSLAGYNAFMLKHLWRHIGTSHVLVVQADGYVLNPRRWDPHWLSYDYIGAPWTMVPIIGPEAQGNLVGNGGFSLRSRRLLELVATVDLSRLRPPFDAEDLVIGHVMYDELVAQGMRFPPPEVAARFSIEDHRAKYGQTLRTSFGFHGKHYFERTQPGQAWRRLRYLWRNRVLGRLR